MGSALVTSGAFAQTAGADASPAGSGVDTDNLASHYSYADFYTKVNGLGDTGKGSDQNGPSDQARSNGQGSVALGSNAVVEQAANAGIAVGVQAHTTANDAVALGAGSVANVANTVSVGSDGTTPLKAWDPGLNNGSGGWTTIASEANTRRVVNMAAGLNDNDAVNLSQLKSAGFDVDSAGAVANQAATYDAASIASGTPSVTLNPGAGNSQYYRNGNRQDGLLPKGTVIGNVADGVQDTDAANVGQVYTIMSEQAGGDGARMLRAGQPMMLGAGAGGSGVDDSTATVSYKTAAYYSQVNGLGNGSGSTPPSDMARTTYGLSGTGGGVPGAVAIGSYATTLGNHGVALGVQAYTSASDAVAIGAGSYANQANTVSVGSDGTGSFTIMNANGTTGTISNPANTRRVVNMAAGQADTDAVNVAQLRGVTGAIGGGAAVNTDGTVAAPTYQLSGRTYHNVGDALAGLDTTTQQLSTDAVKYDTSVHDKVTLSGSNGTKITNLSQGTLSATSTDAVNGAQLFATNQQVDQNTTSITNLQGDVANAVKYDTSAHDKITLGGGASGAKITNLAQGTLSATSTDAVNGAQLFATNQQVDQTRTDITNLYGEVTDSVKYDTSAHDKVTLGGGANGTKITNLSQGTLSATSTDAVNGAQLFATNQQVDQNTTSITNLQGDVANAVKYDTSAHDKVTLAGTSGTKITNLTAGEISATSTDALNGKQLYNTATSTASALGGGAAVNADGTIATPTFTVQGTTAHDVGTALGVIDAATTDNTTSITNLTKNINIGAVGLVQQDQNTRAITVASATDGATVNFAGTAGARQLNGVAAGLADTAAVNLAQLKSAGFTVNAAGTVQNAAATYDTGTIAAGNPGITLNPGTGNSPYFRNSDRTQGYLPKGTVIHNVANGTQDTDAASVGQVFDIVTQTSAGDGTSSVSMLRSSQPMLLGADNGGSGINEPKATIAYKTAAYYSQVAGLADSSGSTPPSDMARVTYNLGGTGGAASGAIAIGSYSTSLANNGVAVGVQSYTSATDAVALGAGSVANQANTVSVGSDGTGSFSIMNADGSTGTIKNQANTRRIVNMAAGQSDTDAVNVAQLKGVTSALGGGSAVNADGTLSKPGYVLGGSTYGDVGTALDAVADMARAGSVDAVVYDTSKHDKLTLGGSKASTPVELSNVANGTANNDAVNVAQLKAAGLNIDTDGNVTNAFVAYDDSTKKAITLGGVGTTGLVALHNVAPGTIGASSSDAVNGSQFYAGVASVAKDLGGNVKVNADGTLSTPNYVLSGNTYSDVGSALGMLDAKAGSGSPEGVVYDDTTHTSVTFGGLNAKTPVALHNVAAGVIGATSFDAVNGAQLYGVASSTAANFGGGATVKTDGTISAPSYVLGGSTYGDVGTALDAVADMARAGSVDAVVYDTSKHDKLTLGGSKSTTPVELSNVANGTANNDAVNVAQLKAAGLNIDTDGNVTNAFVAYDDSTKKSITLGGVGTTGLVTLHNVAAGVIGASSSDAVNGAQLYANAASVAKGMGGAAKVNADGTVSLPNYVLSSQTYSDVGSALDAINAKAETGSLNGVAYDDSAHTSVTFGGQNSKIPVALHNVAAGAVSATSTDATNGGQLYAVAQSVAKDLGGGSQVNSDGTISAPSYTVGGTTVNNVGAAITNLDGRVSTVENFVTNITGQVANAVQYDSSAHDKVTLGGDKGTKVTNLQDATLSASSTDAVTGRQLYATNQEVASLGQQIQNIGDTGSQYISTNTTSGPAAATGSNSIAAGGGATASGASSTAMGDKASATGNNSVAIGANSVADRDNSVSVGSAGQERQITNVADGKAATDAVNMRQFQQGMTSIQRAAFGGVAQATALTMIPDVDQGKTIAVGVGTANYKGYQAGALGASVRVTQNLKVKVGAGYSSGGGTAVGGGMSYQW